MKECFKVELFFLQDCIVDEECEYNYFRDANLVKMWILSDTGKSNTTDFEQLLSTEYEEVNDTDKVDVYQIIIASLLIVVMIVSIVGNILVLLVIMNTRSLRRLNNVLIVSLAAIDLTRSVLVMPLFIVVHLSLVTNLPEFLCPVYHALHMSCEMVSIYNLTAISLERMFVISWPLVYQLVITTKKMVVFVSTLWISGFVYGFLQLIWFKSRVSEDFSGEKIKATTVTFREKVSHSEDGCAYAPKIEYAIFDFIMCLVVPLCVIVVCYLKIFCVVQSQMNRIVPSTSTNIDHSDIMTYHPEPSHFAASHMRNPNKLRSAEMPGFKPLPTSASDSQLAKAQIYDNLQRTPSAESAVSAYSECILDTRPTASTHPELLINVQVLSGTDTPSPKPGRTVQTIREEVARHSPRSKSDPDVKPLSALRNANSSLQPALKGRGNRRYSKDMLQNKRGSVTFKLETQSLGSPSIGKIRVVSIDDDTNFSSEATTTTDTSLSSNNPTHPTTSSDAPPTKRVESKRNSVSSLAAMSHSSRFNSAASIATNASSRSRNLFRLSENKALRLTSIVVGAFMLCWMPYNIIFLIKEIKPEHVSNTAWDIVSALVFLSSAVNPFVYNFYSGEFRRALKRIITCTDKTNIPWA